MKVSIVCSACKGLGKIPSKVLNPTLGNIRTNYVACPACCNKGEVEIDLEHYQEYLKSINNKTMTENTELQEKGSRAFENSDKEPSISINFIPRRFDVCLMIPESMKINKDNKVLLTQRQHQEIVNVKMKENNDSLFLEIIKKGDDVVEYNVGDLVNIEDMVNNCRRIKVDGVEFIIAPEAAITGKKIYVE